MSVLFTSCRKVQSISKKLIYLKGLELNDQTIGGMICISNVASVSCHICLHMGVLMALNYRD